MNQKVVTEADFRKPEFKDAKVEDYEFRADGALVRKDRWEAAVQTIKNILEITRREFEIDEVVEGVRALADKHQWVIVQDKEDLPEAGTLVSIKLEDGSILNNVIYDPEGGPKTIEWVWGAIEWDEDFLEHIVAWRAETP